MKYFESIIHQNNKEDYPVCGDTCRCERTQEGTILVLCDGVGSGVYANIAAITCADRLMELFRSDISFKDACCMVADSMHRARTEEIPFAAFSAIKVFVDGSFTVYSYEAPKPILIRNQKATVIEPHFLTAGYEVIGESFGTLELSDSIFVCSDGVTQAGLGLAYRFGLGEDGVADYLTQQLRISRNIHQVLEKTAQMTSDISGGRYADDTTMALLRAREARQLVIATGPPSNKQKDEEFVNRFMAAPGVHVICGSTTMDIFARQLDRKAEYINKDSAYGAPPEYHIDGIDLVTEGAIMLNQVYNLIDEMSVNPSLEEEIEEQPSTVQRLCRMMLDADIITFLYGRAINDAHTALIFKQVGVRSRQTAVRLLCERLKEMGKTVVTINF